MPVLFCFGLGYSVLPVARYAQKIGFAVSGTTSKKHKDIECFRFDEERQINKALAKATHLVSSVPPFAQCDPVLTRYKEAIRHIPYLCYCSSLSVYGDHNGAWIYEHTKPHLPLSGHGARRLEAEKLWQSMAKAHNAKLSILRIAGIYGRGRNALERLKNSTAIAAPKSKPVVRSDKVFNRIHVDDLVAAIARVVELQLDGIFNICDDEPAPSYEVMLYAAKLLECEAPEFVTYQQAEEGGLLSKMSLGFHREHKRASNERMKERLGLRLLYPNYRKGLEGLAKLL